MLIIIFILLIAIIITTVVMIRSLNKKSEVTSSEEIDKLDNDAKLHFSKELLAFIDNLIEIEINNKIKDSLILRKKIDIRDADADINAIADIVYKALDKKIYINNNETILNVEYIMTYITRRTLLLYMTIATEHNKGLLV